MFVFSIFLDDIYVNFPEVQTQMSDKWQDLFFTIMHIISAFYLIFWAEILMKYITDIVNFNFFLHYSLVYLMWYQRRQW